MENKIFVTVDEAAKELGIPKSWIYKHTCLGKEAIPHVRFGKHIRLNLDEVLAYFQERTK
jgi:excisionase family DNA binding protein